MPVIHMLSADSLANKIYYHSGFTATIQTSFSSPSTTPGGVAYASTHLISSDVVPDTIYIHVAITSTVSSSFSAPSTQLRGIGYDGTNIISTDSVTDKIYVHSGQTAVIGDSFSAPIADPYDVSFDGANLISITRFRKVFIHTGVTSTITSSFLTTGEMAGNAPGVAWDGSWIAVVGSTEKKIFQYNTSGVLQSSFSTPGADPTGIGDYNTYIYPSGATMYPQGVASFARVTRRTRFSTQWAVKLIDEFKAAQNDYSNSKGIFSTLATKLTTKRNASGGWTTGFFHSMFVISANQHHVGTHADTHVDGTDDIPTAVATQDGVMSSTYFQKLASIAASATQNRLVQNNYAGVGGQYIDLGFAPQWVRLMRDTSSNGAFSIYAWHWKKSVSSPLTEYDSGNRVTTLFDLMATGDGFRVTNAADEAGKPYVYIAAG